MSTEHKYYPALDGTRALAALLVLIFHSGQEGLPLPSIVSFGQTGVDLFFVLSGYLITSILLAARTRDWGEVRTFYARRSLRIFPLYYLALVFCALFLFPVSWPFWVYLDNFWLSAGMAIAGPGHLWSLAVEEQFYLVWPCLVLFAPRRFLLRILAGLLIFSFVLRVLLAGAHHDVYSLTLTRLDGLSGGAILAALHAKGRLKAYRGVLLAMVAVSAVLIAGIGMRFRSSGAVGFVAVKYSLLAALYTGCIGYLVCSPEGGVSRALSVRPLRFVGRISYGLYVWHPFVFTATFNLLRGHSPWLKAGLAYPFSFLVACISWYGFERPFVRLKDRFISDSRLAPQAPLQV